MLVRRQFLRALESDMSSCFVSEKARIDESVTIGPFSVIEDDVVIGARTKIDSHVIIRNGTVIGKGNVICSGAQIGVEPQDFHFKGERSRCVIGDNNIIREYATISRATGEDNQTVVGNGNFIMTYVHVAHNIRIGNNIVISSIAQLGGHVEIDDYASIGGHAGIHQFCRIGKYAMLGAKSYLNKDLPPYLLASGNKARVCGLNTTGLVRNLFSWDEIEEIKDIVRLLYRSNYNLTECAQRLEKRNSCYANEFLHFLKKSKRGILLKEDTTKLPGIISLS